MTTAVAAKREVDRSRVDLYRTGSYVTLDLLGQADLGHGLTLDAGLFNLTDQDYIEWADVRGRPVGRSADPVLHAPGPQRIGHAALAVLRATPLDCAAVAVSNVAIAGRHLEVASNHTTAATRDLCSWLV